MSRRRQQSAFHQVSEFNRGRIVAYRDCGLYFRRVQRTDVVDHIPSQCTTSSEDRQIVRKGVTDRSVTSRTITQHIESVTHHSVSVSNIRSRLLQRGLSVRKTSIAWSTLDAQPQTSPPPMDNARLHVAHTVSRFIVNHQIDLLPLPARSRDLSPIENMWSLDAQRLAQITPPAATPNQLWQRVEAAWSSVLKEHIQSLFHSILRRVAVVISKNGGYSGY
ncbi:transposable element Tcb1 transposase [Trichonephila clavipes]|nr:transposable element Tcb1 transposase [Trichonephila clavipes]